MSASSGYGSGGSTPVGPGILTLEGNVGGPVGPNGVGNLFVPGSGPILTTGNPGTNTITISLDGTVATQYDEDVGSAIPVAGILNIIGGASTAGINMNTLGAGNTVEIILNDSLFFPNTNAAGTQGVLFWGGNTFIHNYRGTSTYVGESAGNLTMGPNAVENTGIGANALNSLVSSGVNLGDANTAVGNNCLRSVTDGSWNCGLGNEAGFSVTTGQGNCIIGNSAGSNLTTGNTNILIGGDDNVSPGVGAAGDNYTTESSNICLQNPGVIGDNQVMRLGDDGVVDGKINSTYIAGVYQRAFASPSGVMQIDSTFKVGSSRGTNGQLLIGSTGASPLWNNLTSVGGTVVITNAPNAINLEAAGTGAGASEFPTDIDGPADEAGGILNLFGGPGILSGINNIHTQAVALSNTVSFILNDSLFFPNTQADGSGGVLYWNSIPAVQFLGSGNTFIGKGAGNLTLTTASAVDNTAIGEICLPSLTTSPENTFVGSAAGSLLSTGLGLNCGFGFGALDNLVSGDNNVAIGILAGTNYTTNETNNILISSFGTVGESNTTRIGRTQTAAYMAGVYNANIGTTNAPVFIDNNGKLGTLESGVSLVGSSFLAHVNPGEIIPVLPGQQTSFVGSVQAMVVDFDNFGTFSAGPAVGGASFTAPIDGYYSFSCMILMVLMDNPGNGITTASLFKNGSAIAINQSRTFVSLTQTSTSNGSQPVTVTLLLTAGDIITFALTFNSTSGSTPTYRGAAAGNMATWITGTLIKTAP